MKLTNEEMLDLLTNATGSLNFNRCGLDIKKNILRTSDVLFFDSQDELEGYCLNMLAERLYTRSAIFTMSMTGRITAVVRFSMNDFDVFELDGTWHYWNLSSFVEEFKLDAYGLLNETKKGEWRTITE